MVRSGTVSEVVDLDRFGVVVSCVSKCTEVLNTHELFKGTCVICGSVLQGSLLH